ncbi:MAG: NADH-quinone oxidoreductase subunit L [Elusimicrobia bacterium]|nr:NADH-quinone oxidoreductase subunit L [Elusimicrobiota bacterium]
MTRAALVCLVAPLAALAAGFAFFHRRKPWSPHCGPGSTHWPILLSCAVVTASSWWLAAQMLAGAPALDRTLWTWMSAGGPGPGGLSVDFGLRVDGLGAAVLAMVTLVSGLIHAYAVGYMRGDPGFSRFFLYFHLFLFSMIGLVLSNNYLQLYLFWEGVGLASYLLIGFWRERESARRAALKAFLTNRVGDVCFLFAIFLLARSAGTLRFTEVFARLDRIPQSTLAWIAGLMFMGACAKSAQFPLYIWLPDAMEGPTPTSALMHAATMVTAGVFLMARSWPILERVPGVLDWIAATGAFTALGAAVLAFTKKDLKRILAYSTVSHLGLMMLALGAGNAYAATAHLVMHGFFKATLFLCAGNVLHHIGKSTASVDEAGGPTAGFFSKDLIFEAAVHRSAILGACAALVAVGSGLYIGRMAWLTFFGERPEQPDSLPLPSSTGEGRGEGSSDPHAHHSDPWLEWPVAALAFFSALIGLAVVPTGVLHRLILAAPLWRGEPFPHAPFDWGLGAAALAAALAGIGASWYLAMAKPSWDWQWRKRRPGLERAFDADFGWQPFVMGCVVQPVAALANFVGWTFDLRTWDRFMEAAADSFIGLSEGVSGLSRGLLNQYVGWMAAAAALFLLRLAWVR